MARYYVQSRNPNVCTPWERRIRGTVNRDSAFEAVRELANAQPWLDWRVISGSEIDARDPLVIHGTRGAVTDSGN
jgi:hypothetical protein